jgi:hypothetical protein
VVRSDKMAATNHVTEMDQSLIRDGLHP